MIKYIDLKPMNEKLQKDIQFTKDDLFMNRQGKLSPAQIERLKKGMFDPSKWNRFIVGLMVGGGILLAFRDGLQVLNWQFIISYIVFCGIFYFFYSFYFKRNAKKLEQGSYKVEALEGVVTIPSDNNTSVFSSMSQYGSAISMGERFSGINLNENAFVLQINEKKVYTTKNIQGAFENGRRYRVYLLKANYKEYQNILYGAMVVSAETL